MSSLAIGQSVTISAGDGGSVVVSTNGGIATVAVTPYGGSAQTYTLGPTPDRRRFGPYSEGASVVVQNVSCPSMDCDQSGGEIRAMRKIAVGIVGQSNERGQVVLTDEATTPQAFASLRMPGVQAPLAGCISLDSSRQRMGSMWFKFIDDMYDAGYEVSMFNGAIGSMSMISHACGQVATRANSTAYGQRRTPQDTEDMGHAGDLTVQSGKLFLCTTGRRNVAFARTQYRDGVTASSSKYDFISTVGSQVSNASDPATWGAATLGSTVTDGTVTWTNIDDTNSVAFTNGQIFSESQAGFGWDPYGILERVHMNMQRIQGVQSKHIILCNAQSDLGQSQANYRVALQNIGNYFLRRGYYVWVGLSCFTPTGSTANYNTLSAGVTDALTLLRGGTIYPGRVMTGANLYTAMGSSGNMGSGGAWLQGDNLHLNGLGAVEAGRHWANAFLASI